MAKFKHVLQTIQAGGWGKKNMQCRMMQMTELDIGDGRTTNDRTTIAASATEYYRKLFDVDPDEQDDGRTKGMMQYVNAECDLWMLPGRYNDNVSDMGIAEHRLDDDNDDIAEDGRPCVAADFAGVSVSAQMVASAAASCKRRKTCAADLRVSELWNSFRD